MIVPEREARKPFDEMLQTNGGIIQSSKQLNPAAGTDAL